VVGLRSKDKTLKLGREDSLLSTQLHSVQNLLTLQRKNVSKRKVLLIYQLLLVSRSAGGVVFCCCFFVFHSFIMSSLTFILFSFCPFNVIVMPKTFDYCSKKFAFEISTPVRTLLAYCDTQEEYRKWCE